MNGKLTQILMAISFEKQQQVNKY